MGHPNFYVSLCQKWISLYTSLLAVNVLTGLGWSAYEAGLKLI